LEPSVYKYGDDNYELLKPQWDHFIERLCAAGYVLIVGYSLPESDSQARSKITVAFQVNPNCQARLIVLGMVSVVSRVEELRGAHGTVLFGSKELNLGGRLKSLSGDLPNATVACAQALS
jgi:hypothetical protein